MKFCIYNNVCGKFLRTFALRKSNTWNMQDNLVIVESPAKAKTIEKFLGKDYKVTSSYGHIRDLRKKELSVSTDTLEPYYEIPEEKRKLVADLKSKAASAKKIWLASDEDREGEAISWHLCEVLGLDEEKTSRIVFHEITKSAILEAIQNPRHIDMNLVNAQQARRVLDRIVGFKLSPVLWRKVKPSLSAGRVQSVAVRLIVEREREIEQFKSEPYYKVSAVFEKKQNDGTAQEIKAELNRRFASREEAEAFLELCRNADFTVTSISKKPLKRTPAPPFTTSTMQQEAARKLGFTVSQTMMVAQRLYESGRITYMRTDSVNLSSLCIGASKEEITNLYGEDYSKPRNYHASGKGVQAAHEAIRPTYMNEPAITGTVQEKRLYDLIWKRTLASQMADALLEKTTINISVDGSDETFVANGEIVSFDGFLKVYRESADDDAETQDETGALLPDMKEGDTLDRKEITSVERFTMSPLRYTEASLVKKMEELGIGRPSTYAPTISTIQQREYVMKGDRKGEERQYDVITLEGDAISSKKKKETVGSEKGKLIPTDIGTVVNDFLMENFPDVLDYNFTAHVEESFDKIADGKLQWQKMMKDFYKKFEPNVEKVMNARQEHKTGERQLGTDPKSGRPVFVKIGRFGPVVQMGTADDNEKPRFAQLPKDKKMDSITLDEALSLFALPRTLGTLGGKEVTVGNGRYGAYILYNGQYTSLPKGEDPMTVTLETAIKLLDEKKETERKRHIKTFEEKEGLEVLNGRYGPYITFDGKNYRLPRAMQSRAAELTLEECMKVIEETPEKKETRSTRAKK